MCNFVETLGLTLLLRDNYGAGSSANKQDARRAMDYLCSACGLLTEEFLASPQDG